MTDDDRELGVELGDLRDSLESQEFPISQDELFDEHGDEEVEMGMRPRRWRNCSSR